MNWDDIFQGVGHTTSNNWLDFGGNLDHDADPGIFEGILPFRIGAIKQILLITEDVNKFLEHFLRGWTAR